MKATKIVLGTLLLVLLALAGALAYLPVYLEDHRDLIEAAATRALGRPVEIEGGLTLAWSPLPSIAVQGLRIQNPGWARNPRFARAERVEVQLDLGALWERHIRIARLLVHKADVNLETGPRGQNNWTFGAGARSTKTPRVDTLQVLDSTLVFETAQGKTHRLGIRRLDLQGLGSGKLVLEAALAYRDSPLSVSATSGQEGAAQAARWPFTIRAKIADATIEATGGSSAPFDFSGIEADLNLEGENLRSLRRLIPLDGLAQGPFRLAFALTHDGAGYRFRNIAGSLDAPAPLGRIDVARGEASVSRDSTLSAALEGAWRQTPATLKLDLAHADPRDPGAPRGLEVTATLGDTALSGSLRLASGGARPKITGDLRFTKIDLAGIAPDQEASKQPAPQPGHLPEGEGDEGRATRDSQGTAWSERPLPLAVLRTFDADLTLKADLVTAERIQARDVRGQALLDNGRLRLEGFSASLPGLPLTGRATLDAAAQPPAIDLALAAERVQLAQALSFLSPAPKIDGTLQAVALEVKAQGDTPAALIGTLGGKLTARTARLRPSDKRTGKDAEISLTKPTVTVKPGKPVGLHTGVAVKQQQLTLALTGGPLADLLTQERPWPTIKVDASGKLQRKAFEVRGGVGPLAALLAGRDLRIDLAAHHRGLKASVKGTLARLDGLRGSKLAVKASGASLSALGAVLGADLPEGQPFKVSARLQGGDRRLDVRDLEATSGDSDIAGKLRIRLDAKTRVEATLASHSIDLTPYLDARGDRPTAVKASLSETLPLELLHVLDGTLRWKADHVRIGDFGADDGNLSATLDAGHLRLSVNAGQERLSADVEIRPEKTQWRLNLEHKGKLDLGWLIEEENASLLSRVPTALDVRLSGVGSSLQTLLGSAHGQVELVLGAGRLNKKAAVLPLGDIVVTLLDTINPASRRGGFEDLQCAVFQLEVTDGIATSTRGLALQTEAMNLLGGGALNLRSSEIELHFKTARRKGIGISLLGVADRFIYISGTLREPKVAVDPKGLLLHGGAAWATGGLSLVYDQLFKRLTAFDNPCDAVMRKGERPAR